MKSSPRTTLLLTATPEGSPSGGFSPEVAERLERIEAMLAQVLTRLEPAQARPGEVEPLRLAEIKELARRTAAGDRQAIREHNRLRGAR